LSKLPVIKPKELERILLIIGFERIRQKGSHAFYKHLDGRYTVIPHHPTRDLAPNLLRKILKEINLDIGEFRKLI
jgi:predicted RNA binding protein YcfA (HicA-like mRNA interferase family)